MKMDAQKDSSDWILPRRAFEVAESRLFTFPTRLADPWEPATLEIALPACHFDMPEIHIALRAGVTRGWRRRQRNLLRKWYGALAPPLDLGNTRVFDARLILDSNVAHIFKHVASAVMLAREYCGEITILLRSNASTLARRVYAALRLPVLCTERPVRGQIVSMPDGKQEIYTPYYRELWSEFGFADYCAETPPRVFIARRGPRRLTNEAEVEEFLRSYGFQKFYFEDIPLALQWSLARNAQVVVALHGAALIHIVFNARGVRVVELFHPGYVVKMFRHLTNAMGGAWCGVSGQLTPDVIRELDVKQKPQALAYAPTRIDIHALARALEFLQVGS
jgi:hypothetical protein